MFGGSVSFLCTTVMQRKPTCSSEWNPTLRAMWNAWSKLILLSRPYLRFIACSKSQECRVLPARGRTPRRARAVEPANSRWTLLLSRAEMQEQGEAERRKAGEIDTCTLSQWLHSSPYCVVGRAVQPLHWTNHVSPAPVRDDVIARWCNWRAELKR